jgi:16S rRNA processing protein RimM
MAPNPLVRVGVITGAHGVRGEVKLASFTEVPAAIMDYSPLVTAAGRVLVIRKLKPAKAGFIALLDGVNDRNAAEALKGEALFVPRGRLPAPPPGEVYHHDLIGCRAVLENGAALGMVSAIRNYGAGDLLEIEHPGHEKSLLIPFAPAYVVRRSEGEIVLTLPEGFLDGLDSPAPRGA